jgi:acetyltransferase-like isoleucine patch superfamily enzyme
MEIFRKLNSLFWKYYLKAHGAKIGCNFRAEGLIHILLRDGGSLQNVSIGDNVTMGGTIFIRIRKNGKLIIHSGVRTGTHVWFVIANDAEFEIGENTILGSYSIFNAGHGMRIDANCIFGAFVYMNTSDHNFKRGELIQKQGFFGAPIGIGRDVWLGGQVFINKGVEIGDGAVIGAGSVVTKNIAEYMIAAGNPARVIKARD